MRVLQMLLSRQRGSVYLVGPPAPGKSPERNATDVPPSRSRSQARFLVAFFARAPVLFAAPPCAAFFAAQRRFAASEIAFRPAALNPRFFLAGACDAVPAWPVCLVVEADVLPREESPLPLTRRSIVRMASSICSRSSRS